MGNLTGTTEVIRQWNVEAVMALTNQRVGKVIQGTFWHIKQVKKSLFSAIQMPVKLFKENAHNHEMYC